MFSIFKKNKKPKNKEAQYKKRATVSNGHPSVSEILSDQKVSESNSFLDGLNRR